MTDSIITPESLIGKTIKVVKEARIAQFCNSFVITGTFKTETSVFFTTSCQTSKAGCQLGMNKTIMGINEGWLEIVETKSTKTKSEIFKAAWALAREGAAKFGGSAKLYFAESLKIAYAK